MVLWSIYERLPTCGNPKAGTGISNRFFSTKVSTSVTVLGLILLMSWTCALKESNVLLDLLKKIIYIFYMTSTLFSRMNFVYNM
ncbi:hypothetical protein BX666DRAFT_1023008 [Dichotomocladium elegans]|nr:hypothetical protein BX666DRAFT_1023008 [Dichotomocladium elegans]